MLETNEKFTNNTFMNEYDSVQKIYNMLQYHNMGNEKRDIESLVRHIEILNVHFEKVFQELDDVKEQLEHIQNKDIRKVVANAVQSVNGKVTEVGEQFLSVKDDFLHSIDNCLNEFKDQGAKAFYKTLDFFKIKTALLLVKQGLLKCSNACHKTSERTGKMSEEMDIIGGHAKNIGRIFFGKQPIEVTVVNHKDSGILQGIKNIFTRAGVRLSSMAHATQSAIGKVELLEIRTAKSSIRKELNSMQNTQSNRKRVKKSKERGR